VTIYRIVASISISNFLTHTSNVSKVEEDMGKRLFLILAAGALLLLQFGDCMSAMAQDHQDMKCCGSMPCTPANHGQDCCKNMASPQAPGVLPAKQVSLHGPVVAAIEYPLTLEIVRATPSRFLAVSAPQHSSPDLYTLNASLLI